LAAWAIRPWHFPMSVWPLPLKTRSKQGWECAPTTATTKPQDPNSVVIPNFEVLIIPKNQPRLYGVYVHTIRTYSPRPIL